MSTMLKQNDLKANDTSLVVTYNEGKGKDSYLIERLAPLSYDQLKKDFETNTFLLFETMDAKTLSNALLQKDALEAIVRGGIDEELIHELVRLQLLFDMLRTSEQSAELLRE